MSGQTWGSEPAERIDYGRQIVVQEAEELQRLAKSLGQEFAAATKSIFQCRGSVVVTGMGKAGLIGRKISATLASTGTRSQFLHPAEAVHGDLGQIHQDDVILALSKSGETDELTQLLSPLSDMRIPIIAITSQSNSSLGRAAAVTLELGKIDEACPLGLAPTTSTTAMLAVGDALALVASRVRGFQREDFHRFHPAGSLGWQLSRVETHMRPLEQCRVIDDSRTVREVFSELRKTGRRTGAIMLVTDGGELSGLFTDSDLAKMFESRRDSEFDDPITNVMTHSPISILAGSKMSDVVDILAGRRISELPVVDEQNKPVGLIDITDIVAFAVQDSGSDDTEPALYIHKKSAA